MTSVSGYNFICEQSENVPCFYTCREMPKTEASVSLGAKNELMYCTCDMLEKFPFDQYLQVWTLRMKRKNRSNSRVKPTPYPVITFFNASNEHFFTAAGLKQKWLA